VIIWIWWWDVTPGICMHEPVLGRNEWRGGRGRGKRTEITDRRWVERKIHQASWNVHADLPLTWRARGDTRARLPVMKACNPSTSKLAFVPDTRSPQLLRSPSLESPLLATAAACGGFRLSLTAASHHCRHLTVYMEALVGPLHAFFNLPFHATASVSVLKYIEGWWSELEWKKGSIQLPAEMSMCVPSLDTVARATAAQIHCGPFISLLEFCAWNSHACYWSDDRHKKNGGSSTSDRARKQGRLKRQINVQYVRTPYLLQPVVLARSLAEHLLPYTSDQLKCQAHTHTSPLLLLLLCKRCPALSSMLLLLLRDAMQPNPTQWMRIHSIVAQVRHCSFPIDHQLANTSPLMDDLSYMCS
jgi:hypothetical protein